MKIECLSLSKRRRSKSEWLFDGNDLTRRDGINKPSELSIVCFGKSYLPVPSSPPPPKIQTTLLEFVLLHDSSWPNISLSLSHCRVFLQSNLNETCSRIRLRKKYNLKFHIINFYYFVCAACAQKNVLEIIIVIITTFFW